MRLFSPTNNQLHITHVAYQYQSKSLSLTPPFAFTNFTKNRGISIFRMNQSKPVFAKGAPIKKLTTKISRQTEFTMSRRLSAHNKTQFFQLSWFLGQYILRSTTGRVFLICGVQGAGRSLRGAGS